MGKIRTQACLLNTVVMSRPILTYSYRFCLLRQAQRIAGLNKVLSSPTAGTQMRFLLHVIFLIQTVVIYFHAMSSQAPEAQEVSGEGLHFLQALSKNKRTFDEGLTVFFSSFACSCNSFRMGSGLCFSYPFQFSSQAAGFAGPLPSPRQPADRCDAIPGALCPHTVLLFSGNNVGDAFPYSHKGGFNYRSTGHPTCHTWNRSIVLGCVSLHA